MATFILHSKRKGKITFSCISEGGSVRMQDGTEDGHLGRPICRGGSFKGEPLQAEARTLAQVARKWWKAYIANDVV